MKTTIKWCLFAVIAVVVVSCKSYAPSAQVNYLSESDNAITMRCVGRGNTTNEAKADAEKNAINVLLFRGLPGSSQKVPLIGYNEAEIIQQHASYFQQMYEGKRYLTFVMASQPVSDRKNGQLTVEVKINLRALRSDLEGQGLIRKFGY